MNLPKVLLVVILHLFLGCSFSPMAIDVTNRNLRGIEEIQPIKVTLLSQKKELVQFEIYVENEGLGKYSLIGVHPVIGKIFVLQGSPTEVILVENLGKVKDQDIRQLFLKIAEHQDQINSLGNLNKEPNSKNGVIQLEFGENCE